jgi:hypothetical protein
MPEVVPSAGKKQCAVTDWTSMEHRLGDHHILYLCP